MLRTSPLRRRASRALVAAFAAALVLSLPASLASAVTLHPGDVVVLPVEGSFTPGMILHFNVASGVFDTILPSPPLSAPHDLVVRHDGAILIADATLGLVAVDPGTGAAVVLAGPAAFGGSGPTTLAYVASGDLLLAGPTSVARLPAGQGALQLISGPGLLSMPGGIVDDGAGGAWVCETGLTFNSGFMVRVSAGGVQTMASVGCATNTFPVSPLQIRRGPDGFLYVVSAPFSGPTNYLNAGIYRLDPSTGVATRWLATHFIRGFDFTSSGSFWLVYGQDISHDPYGGILSGPGGGGWFNSRGPLAIVPDGVVPTRTRTWGELKTRYR